MRGSLNLILECHQPQTHEWDIYHAYEKNPDTSSRFVFSAERQNIGWEDRINRLTQRNEQAMKLKKERVLMEGSNTV